MENVAQETEKAISGAIKIDEKEIQDLKERGLKGVRLIVSDKCMGLYEVIGDFFPGGEMAALCGTLVPQCLQLMSLETCS